MDAAVRVQAYRIAEHKDVRLPIMICQDSFITSHAVENIELLEDDIVKTFVGEYEPEHYLLEDNEPFAVGPYAVTNYVMEAKRAQMQGLRNAKQVTLDVAKEFEQISGRSYGLFEEYRMEDADYAMVIIGSAAGTGKDTVDMLRKQGVRAGLLKIRLFRPFPAEEIAEALKNVKYLAIMDRTEDYNGHCGPLGAEIKSALYNADLHPATLNYCYGIGGRDVTVESLASVFEDLKTVEETGLLGETYRYLSVREQEKQSWLII